MAKHSKRYRKAAERVDRVVDRAALEGALAATDDPLLTPLRVAWLAPPTRGGPLRRNRGREGRPGLDRPRQRQELKLAGAVRPRAGASGGDRTRMTEVEGF